MQESVHSTPTHLTVKDEEVRKEDGILLCCQELVSQEPILASLVVTANSNMLPRTGYRLVQMCVATSKCNVPYYWQ